MERRVNKIIENYVIKMKDDIRDKTSELVGLNTEDVTKLLEFVYGYERLTLTKDDFVKRKRVKNMIPYSDRCCAKRANGEQCTRRKKDEYCGTHMKGVPHGIVDLEYNISPTSTKVELWAQDIQGIIYYIDKNMNVYNTEDIVSNSKTPKIIAKYVKSGDSYFIPDFNI
jgi:hypothetical protein